MSPLKPGLGAKHHMRRGSTEGTFKKAPASFFKNATKSALPRAPSQKSVMKWAEIPEDDEEKDSWRVRCWDGCTALWERIPIKHIKIIRPDSKNKRKWVRIIMCVTLYSVILNPIQLAFNLTIKDLAIQLVDVICDVLFLADIYVLLRTAVVLDNKFLKNATLIRNHHLRSANFYIDVISSFPTGMVSLVYPGTALRSLRVLKVLRLSKVGRILKEFSPDKFNTSDTQRLLILLFYLLVATHLLACAFIMICRLNDWPPHFFIPGVDPDDLYQTYTGSLCWALMSLTGIGAILTPISISESIFCVTTILVGVFVYAIILGNVYSTLANYQYLETAYLRKVSSVLEFCKYRNVPEATCKKVTMYYRLMWSRNKGIQDALLLEDMTKPLRQEILMHSFKNIFNKCKWVKSSSDHHKKILAENLRNEIYMPREVIVNAGESPHMVYFISRGTIAVVAQTDSSGRGQEMVGTLRDGGVYGVFHVAKNFLHNATLKTQTFVEVAVMHATDYVELRRVIPELQKLEEAHMKEEIGDIQINKKKKGGLAQTTSMKYVRAHRRESLANKLMGLLGGSMGSSFSSEGKIAPSEVGEVASITDIDSKASAGTTDDLFGKEEEPKQVEKQEGPKEEGPKEEGPKEEGPKEGESSAKLPTIEVEEKSL